MQVRSSNYEDTRDAEQETVTRPILVNSLMSAIPANVYRSMLSFPWSKPRYASSEMPYRLLLYSEIREQKRFFRTHLRVWLNSSKYRRF